MPFALSFRVEIDAKRIAAEIDKELINLRRNTGLSGQLVNNAVFDRNGERISLFRFLDSGTRRHTIPAGADNILANKAEDFIVTGSVEHPGTPPHDITSRTFAFFEEALSRKIAGTSTRALTNRRGQNVDFELVRQTFIEALEQARRYAAEITPSNWASVKDGYEIRLNRRRVEE